MDGQTTRKSFKYKLNPTPEQARRLERTLMLCRHVYHAALGERREAWRMCGVSVSYYQKKAELPDLKATMPAYAEINGQVLQDVVVRVDRAYQAFFRRVRPGREPGYPPFPGAQSLPQLHLQQVGEQGARFDNGFLVLSKIGRMAVRWSRPLEGMPKTVTVSREADGWYVCFSCAVPMQPRRPPAGDGHRRRPQRVPGHR